MRKTVIEPLYDRIVAKRVEAETSTQSGLVIPEAARQRPQEAIVIAVGCGAIASGVGFSVADEKGQHQGFVLPYMKPLVSVGDRVLIGKYAGSEVLIGTEEFLVLRESEVLGIVRTEETPAEVPAPAETVEVIS